MFETKHLAGPPSYTPVDAHDFAEPSKWNPLHWPTWAKITVPLVTIACIAGIVAGAVEGTKAEAYPDYSYLNYTIAKRYEGTDFFDNFDYWDTYDPADGFVQYV